MSNNKEKSALTKISAYLSKRTTGATAPEVSKGAGVALATARKLLSLSFNRDETRRKCRVEGKSLFTYTNTASSAVAA